MAAMLFQQVVDFHPETRVSAQLISISNVNCALRFVVFLSCFTKVEFSTAFSGEEALRLSTAHHFDVITIDELLSEDYCKRSNLFPFYIFFANDRNKSYAMYRKNEMLLTSSTRAKEHLGDFLEASSDDISLPYVVFDRDRLSSSKRRKIFFEEEGFNHEVQSNLSFNYPI